MRQLHPTAASTPRERHAATARRPDCRFRGGGGLAASGGDVAWGGHCSFWPTGQLFIDQPRTRGPTGVLPGAVYGQALKSAGYPLSGSRRLVAALNPSGRHALLRLWSGQRAFCLFDLSAPRWHAPAGPRPRVSPPTIAVREASPWIQESLIGSTLLRALKPLAAPLRTRRDHPHHQPATRNTVFTGDARLRLTPADPSCWGIRP